MRVGGWKYNQAIQVELAAEADEIINFMKVINQNRIIYYAEVQ